MGTAYDGDGGSVKLFPGCSIFYRKMCINLNKYSFDEWLEFIFNHPVTEMEHVWYFKSEWAWECDAEHIVK
ncbi:MAG: hypothetical protein NVSMB56_17020 [Pyrinomonadaceae bacterium]